MLLWWRCWFLWLSVVVVVVVVSCSSVVWVDFPGVVDYVVVIIVKLFIWLFYMFLKILLL